MYVTICACINRKTYCNQRFGCTPSKKLMIIATEDSVSLQAKTIIATEGPYNQK